MVQGSAVTILKSLILFGMRTPISFYAWTTKPQPHSQQHREHGCLSSFRGRERGEFSPRWWGLPCEFSFNKSNVQRSRSAFQISAQHVTRAAASVHLEPAWPVFPSQAQSQVLPTDVCWSLLNERFWIKVGVGNKGTDLY